MNTFSGVLVLALLGCVAFSVEGAKMKCTADKKVDPMPCAPLFMKCMGVMNDKDKALQCGIKVICKGKLKAETLCKWLEEHVPAGQEKMVGEECKKCMPHIKKLEKNIKDKTALKAVETCMTAGYNKMCK